MFTLIMPIDTNRLRQFKETKQVYDSFPQVKEFIMPTRTYSNVRAYLIRHNLMKDVRLVQYEHKVGFNPSKALNIGVRKAKYENIIISSPEVKPLTNVLEQLEELVGRNVICQVFDETEDKKMGDVLVSSVFRSDTPAMYFLAMYQKSDIEKINGWDEDFMKGYAYEDNDFGERWKRAGIPFEVHDEIKALHQYHPRSETIKNGLNINFQKLQENNGKGVVRCVNGLNMLK